MLLGSGFQGQGGALLVYRSQSLLEGAQLSAAAAICAPAAGLPQLAAR